MQEESAINVKKIELSNDDWLAIEREYCARSLANFVKRGWHVLEPGAELKWGWALDAICEHLEAVHHGQILKLLANVPPGPMRYDSMVETDNGPVPLCDIRVGERVLTHMGRYMPVEEVHEQGVLPILEIQTNSGRVTHAAPSHPYLTPRGWVKASDLVVGDCLAAVNPILGDRRHDCITPEEARLLGYMVGDGSLTHKPICFTNADDDTIEDLIYCCKSIGIKYNKRRKGKHWVVSILGGEQTRSYFEKHGIMWKNSYTKRIPEAVKNSSKEIIRNFVGAYWSCDGMIDVRSSRTRGSSYRSSCTTVSEHLADDLLYCLGLIGIFGRKRNRQRKLDTKKQPGGIYRSFNIEINNEQMTARFKDLPGLCARKNKLLSGCRNSFEKTLNEDEIVSIAKISDARCMCLTVAEDHSFVCSGIAVKNCMKSLLFGVFFPAWEWGPMKSPQLRHLGTAHSLNLAIRDSMKCRRLIQSEWYQTLWPLALTSDSNAKVRFENEKTGFREAMAFTSMTGSRGDRVGIDDPLSVDQANSEVELDNVIRTFSEALPTRVNNEKSAFLMIMQRLHEKDPSGYVLSRELGYTHLCLPMEFEPERRCITSIGFEDPRTEDGELLFPERFSRDQVDDLKKTLGSYAASGQLQQRPVPREGGMFHKDWFEIVGATPSDCIFVRGWDLAASEKRKGQQGPAYTAGVKVGWSPSEKCYYIAHAGRGQLSSGKVEKFIKNTASQDGKACSISVPQDPGQAGKSQVRYIAAALSGYNIHFSPESGSKETRAEPIAAQAEAGNVKVIKGSWNDDFFDEICMFPNSTYKDQADAMSRAFSRLFQMIQNEPDDDFAAPIILNG